MGEVPEQRHFAGLQAKTRSAPQPPSNPVAPIDPQDPPTPNPDATIAPIEKDNDSVGDGEKEACQARIMDFLAAIGLAGIIAIAFAVLFLGIMGTLVTQALWSRYDKKPNWQQQQGQKV